MNHIEKEYYLELGRKKVDVSNVSTGKSLKALELYNEAVTKYSNKETTLEECMKTINIIGVSLIKHNYDSLRIRFNPIESIIEIIKRKFITIKDIYNLNKEQYEEFQAWAYFAITGEKKKDLEAKAEITTMTMKMYQRAKDELNLSPDECLESLMTLLRDQTKQLKTYTTDHKVS